MFFANLTQRYKEDIFIVLGILLCAVILRAPYFDYPPSTVFDEGVFSWFITNTAQGTPFFEPHPPLGWMVFGALVPELKSGAPYWSRINTGSDFYDFPYKKIRLFNVYLGSLLAVGVFVLARLLGFSRYLSAIPAYLVVVDNALVFYSRVMLPDTLLLFLGIAGLCVALISTRLRRPVAVFVGLVSGLLLGLSGSVKWTGFGFLAVALVCVLLYRRWKLAIPLIIGALLAYGVTFSVYFGMMKSGLVNHERSFYHSETIDSFLFPGSVTFVERLKSAVGYSQIAYTLQRGDGGKVDNVVTLDQGGPLRWPLSMGMIKVWHLEGFAQFIVIFGNPIGWTLGLFSFLVVFGQSIYSWWKNKRLNRLRIFLIIAYLGNYIPFFFVSRKMFLYHYFPALLFSYLLVPVAFYILWECLGNRIPSLLRENAERIFFFSVLALTAAVFLSVSPMTYGF